MHFPAWSFGKPSSWDNCNTSSLCSMNSTTHQEHVIFEWGGEWEPSINTQKAGERREEAEPT